MKFIFLFAIGVFIFSCKSQQLNHNENESLYLLEEVLNDLYGVKNKNINLSVYTKEMDSVILTGYIRSLKLLSDADPSFYIDSTWLEDFNDYNELIAQSKFSKWNILKLNISGINSEFPLKKKIYIEQMEEVKKKDSLSKKELYEMQMVNWYKETGILDILKASSPVFSKKSDKVMLFTSNYSLGETAWLFDKINGRWSLKLKKDIVFY